MLNFILSGFADEASKSLDGQLEALKRNGMSFFEPRGIDGKNISDFTPDEARALKEKLDKADVGISSIGSFYGKIEITDDFEPHFEAFKNTVEVAKILDAKYIRMFSFYFTKGEKFEDYKDEVIRRVKAMADWSFERGVFCCLENEKEIYGDNAERNLEVLESCGGRLFAIVDPANYIQCGVDPLEAYEKVKHYVRYLHIKDAFKENGKVVPAGCGDGSVAEIIRRFACKDLPKYLSLEPHLSVFEGLEGLEKDGKSASGMDGFRFASKEEAFDAAVSALKKILASMEKGKIRLGIIGMGNMGSSHQKFLMEGKVPDLELVAIADLKADRRAAALEKMPSLKAYNDGSELIHSGEVDAVIVATPHYLHPTLASEAMEAGLDVMIEKPAGVFTKAVREANAVAEKTGRVYAIMFNQRTNPCYIKLREMIKSGEYGEIKRVNWIITNWFRTQAYYNSGGWRATWEGEGGGVLLNQCPHNLDLWQWMCGMPSKIRAFCHEGKWHDIEVEDDVTIYAEYPNGATGVFITTTGDDPGTNRLEITLDRAKIVCEGNKISLYELEKPTSEFCMTCPKGFASGEGKTVPVTVAPHLCSEHAAVLNAFADKILRGGALVGGAEEGINGLTISNAAHLSSWLGETVEIPLDEDLFLSELNKKIASSRKKKTVVEQVQGDMNSTFG